MLNNLRAFAAALAAGLTGGLVWSWLAWPLPWMIGPLVFCALANSLGAHLRAPVLSRNGGQWIIGTAMGTYFTSEALRVLAQLGLPLVLSLLYTVLLGGGFAWALHRFAGASIPTAVFAGAVGGASEMALQGERNGAKVETIAAVHSTRVMLVVLTLPFIYRWLDVHGGDAYVPGRADIVWSGLGVLAAATLTGGALMSRLNTPNAWMLGALLVTIALTASGNLPSGLPSWVTNTGQLLIGLTLGTRIEEGFFTRAPRLLGVVAASTLVAMGVSAVFGLLLAHLSALPAATMILATAPGGMAEMSVTAKVLQLGVPIVTSFHIVRLLVLVMTGGLLYRLVARRMGWPVNPVL